MYDTGFGVRHTQVGILTSAFASWVELQFAVL